MLRILIGLVHICVMLKLSITQNTRLVIFRPLFYHDANNVESICFNSIEPSSGYYSM